MSVDRISLQSIGVGIVGFWNVGNQQSNVLRKLLNMADVSTEPRVVQTPRPHLHPKSLDHRKEGDDGDVSVFKTSVVVCQTPVFGAVRSGLEGLQILVDRPLLLFGPVFGGVGGAILSTPLQIATDYESFSL